MLVCGSGEQWRRNLVRVGRLRDRGEGLADRRTQECWALNVDSIETYFLLTVTTSKMRSSDDCWIWVWFVPFSEKWRKLLTRFTNLIKAKLLDVVYLGKLMLTKFATYLISYYKTGWQLTKFTSKLAAEKTKLNKKYPSNIRTPFSFSVISCLHTFYMSMITV